MGYRAMQMILDLRWLFHNIAYTEFKYVFALKVILVKTPIFQYVDLKRKIDLIYLFNTEF